MLSFVHNSELYHHHIPSRVICFLPTQYTRPPSRSQVEPNFVFYPADGIQFIVYTETLRHVSINQVDFSEFKFVARQLAHRDGFLQFISPIYPLGSPLSTIRRVLISGEVSPAPTEAPSEARSSTRVVTQ